MNFTLCLKDEAARFSNIHAAIRFCQSVDAHTEGSRKHLVHTFLSTSQGDFPEAELIPVGLQHVSVHELFSNLLRNRADWLPSNFTQAWLDPSVFPTEDPGQNWQAPYIFTVAEVNQESFELVGRNGIGTAKELGSVLCKMVLDNRVVSDYLNLGDDYLRKVVGLSGNDGPISNLSLDARLFFALSRRGALAVTTRTDEMPGYFVLPSFLNLVEILRSRWHMGNVVNISLDAAIRRVATSMDNNPSQLLDQMFVLRSAFANFMRDPVPYLFDGGSVTELAEQAQREFWLLDLRQVIAEKLDMLDKLVQDVVERRRIQELMR